MLKRRKLAGHLHSPDLSDEIKADIHGILTDNKVVLPGWSPTFVRSLGDVKSVIDVGVLKGTPALYDAFPDAWLVLVEALPMYAETCHHIVAGRNGGEVHVCAVGSREGTVRIRHYPDRPATSSLLRTAEDSGLALEEIEIPLRRLDSLLASSNLVPDTLLKIDVEGMELEVLKGAVGLLHRVKFIIAETSIRQRHQHSYRFAELVAFLAQHGFQLYDALRITRSKAMQPGASIMDAVFINESMADG